MVDDLKAVSDTEKFKNILREASDALAFEWLHAERWTTFFVARLKKIFTLVDRSRAGDLRDFRVHARAVVSAPSAFQSRSCRL